MARGRDYIVSNPCHYLHSRACPRDYRELLGTSGLPTVATAVLFQVPSPGPDRYFWFWMLGTFPIRYF